MMRTYTIINKKNALISYATVADEMALADALRLMGKTDAEVLVFEGRMERIFVADVVVGSGAPMPAVKPPAPPPVPLCVACEKVPQSPLSDCGRCAECDDLPF